MCRGPRPALSLGLALVFALSGVLSAAAYHEDDEEAHPFADERFEARWARTDLPVSEAAVARTWVWGAGPFSEGRMEPYLDAPDGERLVQYFDKSRMELNDPSQPDDDIWVVTQGRLALDMMRGRVQLGDEAFAPHSEGPSTRNVAGDSGPENGGPTYETMGELIDDDPREEGTVINERLSREGIISIDESLDTMGVTAAERVTRDWVEHTVASVFWDFMNAETTVWADEAFTIDTLFTDPFYATGLPATEAYWAEVQVDGEQRDVLVQCFERRCLTYTPDNPAGWEVESGNVGQHYYRWLETHKGPLVPITSLATDLVQPRGVTYTEDGVYVAEAGDGGDECAPVDLEFEEGVQGVEFCAGLSGAVTVVDDDGASRVIEDLPSLLAEGQGSGPHDVAFDDEGNMYVVIGMGGPPELRDLYGEAGEMLATIVRVDDGGELTVIADLAQYEAEENPDGGELDTNPYAIAFDGEDLIATDAGGNSLLRIDLDDEGDHEIETVAVFENRDVDPPADPELEDVDALSMEPVPTGVATGPDGNYYVAELTGFPFKEGAARVYEVTPDGEMEVYAEGLTNPGDLAFDGEGRLYVAEMVAGGLLTIDEDATRQGDLSSVASRLIRIDEEGEQTDLEIRGIYFATGLAVGAEDELYAAHLSVIPAAELVRIDY